MAQAKKDLDPVAERLMAFVNKQGGPSPVASKLGKHPQLFYNIRDGKSKPSMDTLREVKQVYGPGFNLDWVIMGEMTAILDEQADQSAIEENYTEAKVTEVLTPSALEELITLRVQDKYKDILIADLQSQVDYLKQDKDKLYMTAERNRLGDRPAAPLQKGADGSFRLINSLPRTAKMDKATFATDADMVLFLQQANNTPLAQS